MTTDCEEIPATKIGRDGREYHFRGFDEDGHPEYVREWDSAEERRLSLRRALAPTRKKHMTLGAGRTTRGREVRTRAVRSGGKPVRSTGATAVACAESAGESSPPGPPGPPDGDEEGSDSAGQYPALPLLAGQSTAVGAVCAGAFS